MDGPSISTVCPPSESDREAIAAFFEVYETRREQMREVLLDTVASLPAFAPVLAQIDPEQQRLQELEQHERERAAVIDGEWDPYLTALHAQGVAYARMGLSFSEWSRLLTAFRSALIGPLHERYGEDSEQFHRAILGMDAFIDLGISTIGAAYVAERQELIAAAEGNNRLIADAYRRRAQDLARSNRDLDNFAYIASHDLRSPLRNVDNLAQWIAEDLGDDLPGPTRRHVELLQKQVRRMDRLLDDLLEYSRAGRRRTESEDVELGDLLSEAVKLAAIPETFTVDLAVDDTILHCPRPPLMQVALNLISNAVKHHDREDGKVEITSRVAGGLVAVTVRDDGEGIDPSLHERAFEMFQQLKPPGTVDGTGMGLALVKKVVERHGGEVGVESTPGAGAAFTFTWPLRWREDEEQ